MRTSTILKVLILYLIIELLLECSGKPVKDQNKKKNEVTKKIHETKGKTINKKIENNKKKGKTKPKEKSKKSDEKNPVKKFAIDATKKAATTVADAVGASIMLGAGGLPLLGRLFIILEFRVHIVLFSNVDPQKLPNCRLRKGRDIKCRVLKCRDIKCSLRKCRVLKCRVNKCRDTKCRVIKCRLFFN